MSIIPIPLNPIPESQNTQQLAGLQRLTGVLSNINKDDLDKTHSLLDMLTKMQAIKLKEQQARDVSEEKALARVEKFGATPTTMQKGEEFNSQTAPQAVITGAYPNAVEGYTPQAPRTVTTFSPGTTEDLTNLQKYTPLEREQMINNGNVEGISQRQVMANAPSLQLPAVKATAGVNKSPRFEPKDYLGALDKALKAAQAQVAPAYGGSYDILTNKIVGIEKLSDPEKKKMNDEIQTTYDNILKQSGMPSPDVYWKKTLPELGFEVPAESISGTQSNANTVAPTEPSITWSAWVKQYGTNAANEAQKQKIKFTPDGIGHRTK